MMIKRKSTKLLIFFIILLFFKTGWTETFSEPTSKNQLANQDPSEENLQVVKDLVRKQVLLLRKGDQQGFKKTLTPSLQHSLTKVQFDRCRRRMLSTEVEPDWDGATKEVQTEGSEKGLPYLFVCMWGHGSTPFYQIKNRFFAGELWCLPRVL